MLKLRNLYLKTLSYRNSILRAGIVLALLGEPVYRYGDEGNKDRISADGNAGEDVLGLRFQKLNQSGLIPLLICVFGVMIGIIVLVYLRVQSSK